MLWEVSIYFYRDVIPYKGSDHEDYKKGGKCHSLNPKVKKGTQEADNALKLSLEDRLKLVVDLQPSSDEEEEEEMDVEGMQCKLVYHVYSVAYCIYIIGYCGFTWLQYGL